MQGARRLQGKTPSPPVAMPKRKRDEVPVDFVSRFPSFTRPPSATPPIGTVALPAQHHAAVGVQELTINFVLKKCPRVSTAKATAHPPGAQGTFTPRLHPNGTPKLHPDGTPRLRQICDDCAANSRKRSTMYNRARSDASRAKRVAYEQATLGEEVDLSGERSPPHP